jgi:ATP-dependent DNA helicase RecG
VSRSSAGGQLRDDRAVVPPLPSRFPAIDTAHARLLQRMGLTRAADLLLHLPLRYEDETRRYSIRAAVQRPAGETSVIEGVVLRTEVQYRPRRILTSTLADDSGELTLRLLHFYPNQQRQLSAGALVRAVGEVRHGLFGPEMVHPRWRVVEPGTPLADRLTPVYPTTKGLAQAVLRRLILRAFREADVEDTLPTAMVERLALEPFAASLRLLHEPPPSVDAAALADRTHPAWRRMKFDELLAQQLSMRMHRNSRSARHALPLRLGGKLSRQVLATAGLDPTRAQARVLAEISADLARSQPMQRLLQGDVGSGKTLVAALAAAQAVEAGAQVAVMAPTELLAEQTFRKFEGWFATAGIEVAWLAGSVAKKKRDAACARLASGDASIAVGTHALFQQGVDFQRLALAIVDEQHRFGVNQRLALRGKGGIDGGGINGGSSSEAHLLMMTATPIPRTLAMACYADLDVSTIDELPPGRSPISTRLVADHRRDEVIQRVRDACMQGRQAYWVCPLIEESEALQLQTAVDTHAALCATFPELAVGLVHGRQKAAEKAAAMAAFKEGALQLLVATTVIEVGVDVPNASLMVIEHAERMGLAQLHQLRGRVGRGSAKSACILLYQTPLSPLARERLKVVYESSDGFEIARRDLELRGPGELMGARQSGLPMLRFADPVQDVDLLEAAVEAAGPLLQSDPDAVRRHLARWLPDALAWLNG